MRFTLPWRERVDARATRGGRVKVSPHDRCLGLRLSPHPDEHLTMLVDPPPPGQGYRM
jgi:hypothetical protein